VLAEPIQTVMRRYGVQGAYEKLKEVTRGKTVAAADLHGLIRSLEIPQAEKDRLLAMTPASYIGKAAELASAAMGQKPIKAPAIAKGSASGPRMPLDEIVARAQKVYPGQPIGYVLVPGKADRPVRVRFRLADDPHPNGISSVWLNPVSGEVLAARKWQDLDAGNGAVAVIFPLHTGELGGVAHQVVTALLGLALGGLGFSGIWLWWRRRAMAAAARRNNDSALSSRTTS
jgi:uncharacterized iron-regulated membrane protein